MVIIDGQGTGGPEFREAYQYFHAHRQAGDLVWQSFPEVYEVYHGTGWAGFDASVPYDQVVREACGHRLWLITPPDGAVAGHTPLARLHQCLTQASWVQRGEQYFRGLRVLSYEQPNREAKQVRETDKVGTDSRW